MAQLRVDISDFEGHCKNAQYRYFSVGDSTNYKLRVGGYMAGPPPAAGDSLGYHNGMQFTTRDRDNDRSSGSCATLRQGAWWYNNCVYSNLNGKYLRGANDCNGVFWGTFNTAQSCYSLKWSEMKLRQI